MSRGLVAAERWLLAQLRTSELDETIRGLAQRRNHDIALAGQGRACEYSQACCDGREWDPTVSQYETMRRAVRSLERKGLLETEWRTAAVVVSRKSGAASTVTAPHPVVPGPT